MMGDDYYGDDQEGIGCIGLLFVVAMLLLILSGEVTR
jgi:hypothetical protein